LVAAGVDLDLEAVSVLAPSGHCENLTRTLPGLEAREAEGRTALP